MSMQGIILTQAQNELLRWYWCENRTLTEIAELRRCSYGTVKKSVDTLRAVFASHGKDLPRFNTRGRPRHVPVLPETAVI